MGKLERWNAVAKGSPGEVGFLVLPKGDDYIAMGLFFMRPEDNLLAWPHTWRVFEIIAHDLSAQSIDLSALKHCTLPSEDRIKALTADTMNDFAQAVGKGNFDGFYNRMSTTFKLQSTPACNGIVIPTTAPDNFSNRTILSKDPFSDKLLRKLIIGKQ